MVLPLGYVVFGTVDSGTFSPRNGLMLTTILVYA